MMDLVKGALLHMVQPLYYNATEFHEFEQEVCHKVNDPAAITIEETRC